VISVDETVQNIAPFDLTLKIQNRQRDGCALLDTLVWTSDVVVVEILGKDTMQVALVEHVKSDDQSET
jgi:hypothetical protein